MPTAIDTALEGLAKSLEGIAKGQDDLQKSLSKPDHSGLRHYDDKGRVTGFLEETDEEVNFRIGESKDAVVRKSYRDTKRGIYKTLRRSGYIPIGYEGAKFDSARDFFIKGLNGYQSDAFRQAHYEHLFGKMSKAEDSSIKKAIQGMNESQGAEGGFTVMPEFSNTIIDRIYSNDLFGDTDNYTVSGNNMTFLANAETSRATGSRHGGAQGYWIPEGGTITKSKPTLREVSLKLAKLGAVVYLTQELIDDGGTALEQYIARKIAEEFNFMIGDAIFNGPGGALPLGIGNAPSLISVAVESGQIAPNYLMMENLTKMFSRFYMPNYGNAKWYSNQDLLPYLLTMVLGIGAAGVPVYMPPGGISGAPYGSIYGRPNQNTEFNATRGTTMDMLVADLKQILSISKQNIMQAVSMHVEFLTDQLALRFTMRLNARPWESAPIMPFKGSQTQSSFVVLDTRS